MFNIILENKNGVQLNFGAGTPYTITEFSGLNPPKATINTNTTATLDGGKYNSSKIQMRSINLAFAIETEAEKNRLAVYKIAQPKNYVKLYYQSDLLDIFIEGYVEDVDPSYFAKKQIMTISILCPFPFFKAAQEAINDLSSITNMFHFPFASEGGKNLIPYPYYQTTRTNAGVTYTDNGDGTITVDGTSTSSTTTAFVMVSRDDSDWHLPAGNYILSGGLDNNRRIVINYMQQGQSTATTLAVSSGSDTAFTVTDAIAEYPLQVGIYTTSGASYDDVTIYPMIRYSTYTDDSWQAYNYGELVFGAIDTLTSVEVVNAGSVTTGLTFELYASNSISNPKILNYETGEYISLDFDMEAGDLITISTGQGNKTVTLLRDGVETNIFNYLSEGITWLQLDMGGSTFVYEVGEGIITNLHVTISHYDLFEGV